MARTSIPRPQRMHALASSFDVGASALAVCGPPGCGKSQLVRSWAADLDENVLAVELTEADDLATFTAAMAKMLELGEGATAAAVGHALSGRGNVVVVLDDFDRLVGSAESMVRGWREDAPRVRWVVTSRRRPELLDADVVEVGAMNREQAIELFIARAKDSRPDFEPTAEVREVIATLIDELDRIPLAVELAASRINALGPAEILARLPQRFRLLRERGRTLQGAIAASWELLDDDEREVLAQCAVFRGGFSTRSAEAVVELEEPDAWVVDILQELVERSLLVRYAPPGLPGEVRFDMLSSIREFVASEQPRPAAIERHARHFLDACTEQSHAMRRAGGESARLRLELESSNLLAAFRSADDPALVVDLALTLDRAFRLGGALEEWRATLERAGQVAKGRRAALVHRASGELAMLSGEFEPALIHLEAARQAAETESDYTTLAWTEFLTGEVRRRSGDAEMAVASLRASVKLAQTHDLSGLERIATGYLVGALVDAQKTEAAREALARTMMLKPSSDLRDEANMLKRLAYAQHYLGNVDEQVRLTEEALAIALEAGDRRLAAVCRQGLGDAAFVRGDYAAAREAWGEALSAHRALGARELEGALLGNLGSLEHREDNLEAARRAYRQALRIHASTGARPYEAVAWFGLGVLEFELGHLPDARAAMTRVAELNRSIGNVPDEASAYLILSWIDRREGHEGDYAARAAELFDASETPDWAVLARGESGETDDRTVNECRKALAGQVADRRLLHVRAASAVGADVPEERPSLAPGLIIEREANWFEVDGERVNMRRRRAPRHILAHLLVLRQDHPGETMDVYDAFEVGWPGEVATVEAATDRVYWAIRTLRKLGLEDILVTGGEGYLLDPNVVLVVE